MCKGPEEGRSTELRRTRTAEGAAETGEMGRGQVPESFLEQMAESRFSLRAMAGPSAFVLKSDDLTLERS